MTTSPSSPTPSSPTIPLTAEARAAYDNLYAKLENAIQNTADVGILEALNSSKQDVDQVLTNDNMYRLHANTAMLDALVKQINNTNDGLKTLKDQIAAVASHIDETGDIVAAISKVLTLIPGA